MKTFLLVLFLSYSLCLSAQPGSAINWTSQLDRVSSEMATRNYKSASRLLIPLMSELMRKNGGLPLPKLNEKDDIPKGDANLASAVNQLRTELSQGNAANALRITFGLGIALNQADAQLSGPARLSQERAATPELTTGRASIVSASKLMLAAYRANEFAESERFAQKILDTQASEDAATPGVAHFRHGAFTILGLIALNRKDTAGAKNFLNLSVSSLQPDRTVSGGQPSFALAQALLKLGDKDAVMAFLSACLRFDGWSQSKDKMKKYSDEILSGQRTSFAPDDFLIF
jgi:hypothetical protein